MVGDATLLKIDQMIRNSKHPEEEEIQLDMDLTYDVEERLNSPEYGNLDDFKQRALRARRVTLAVLRKASLRHQ